MRVRWSSLATRRAADIVDYIARDRPQAALDWIAGLEQRIESLASLPFQGRAVPEWDDPSLRQILFGEYRIIYEVSDRFVDIMTIKHGHQELLPESRELHGADPS